MNQPSVKKDCFAYNVSRRAGEGCKVLRDLYCKHEECKFYKPKGTECNSCNKDRFHLCTECKESRKGIL